MIQDREPLEIPSGMRSRKVFWATWLGWMLDGFDASIYAYVLVHALTDRLPASGIEPTPANISFYGGVLFAIFMVLSAYGIAGEILDDVVLFFVLLPPVGFFTNGIFSLFTIWLPEMFPSELRGAGAGFAFSFGRLLGAAGPFLIGSTAAATGSLSVAITLFSATYVAGLPFITLSPKTEGRPLPQ